MAWDDVVGLHLVELEPLLADGAPVVLALVCREGIAPVELPDAELALVSREQVLVDPRLVRHVLVAHGGGEGRPLQTQAQA